MQNHAKKHSTALYFIALVMTGIVIAVLISKYTTHAATTMLSIGNNIYHKIPKRIISLTPLGTETIFALGCGCNVVGVSDFCNYPPAACQKQHLGGTINPSLEKLISLQPDMVVVLGLSTKVANFCQQHNIPVIHLKMADIQGYFRDVKKLGQILGCPQKASQLCTQLKNNLNKLHEKTSSAPRVRIFLSLSHIPGSLRGLSTMGSKTTLNELITLAGGLNIFNDLTKPYAQISAEALVNRQPQVIIEPLTKQQNNPACKQLILNDWAKLSQIPAVVNKRIYFTNADLIMKPGPRMYKIALQLAKLIHPELFGD